MTNEKKVTKKVATKKATINPDTVAVVAAILLTKMTSQEAAIQNAQRIVEQAYGIIGE